jgi:hypothetical protein
MASALNKNFRGLNRDYAMTLVHTVCCLAGAPELFKRRIAGRNVLTSAIKRHDTARLFEWLVSAMSYRGIADSVAENYMRRHGQARWSDIEAGLAANPSCPKLTSYWQFEDCRYQKGAGICAEPVHLPTCPLPALPLRNGHLNQMACSLFLFIRDIAQGDLVAWIDTQLEAADDAVADDRLARMRMALIEPLRCIFGASDKVVSVAMADLLLAADWRRPRWAETGATMIAVDRLVHNFLHRTGILRRLEAEHAYGPSCYSSKGCGAVLDVIAVEIDARQFNAGFPKTFPRFVQHAIWRYCAASGLDICNGNNINDRLHCENQTCRLFGQCDRRRLREMAAKSRHKSLKTNDFCID